MGLQNIIVQLTAEMDQHRAGVPALVQQGDSCFGARQSLAEDDADIYFASPAAGAYGHEANMPVFRSAE